MAIHFSDFPPHEWFHCQRNQNSVAASCSPCLHHISAGLARQCLPILPLCCLSPRHLPVKVMTDLDAHAGFQQQSSTHNQQSSASKPDLSGTGCFTGGVTPGLSFLQVMSHFESEFFGLLGEVICEPADKSQRTGQSPNPCYSA